jgi:hypothetical protein
MILLNPDLDNGSFDGLASEKFQVLNPRMVYTGSKASDGWFKRFVMDRNLGKP